MSDTILTWKFTNLITIAVMIVVISTVLVLAAQTFHWSLGNQPNG